MADSKINSCYNKGAEVKMVILKLNVSLCLLQLNAEKNKKLKDAISKHWQRKTRVKTVFNLKFNSFELSHSSQCSMTDVTKAVVCVILSVGWCI